MSKARYLEPGTSALIWARIEELSGKDLSAATIDLSVNTSREPASWVAPDDFDLDAAATGLIRAATQVTAARVDDQPTTYHLFVRVAIGAETEILYAGIFRVR